MPFLFLLCSKGLPSFIAKVKDECILKGLKFGTRGLSVSHLLFVDDSFMLMKACRSDFVLEGMYKFSLQCELADLFGVRLVECHDKYLGLPTFTGRCKRELFNFIKSRVWDKVKG